MRVTIRFDLEDNFPMGKRLSKLLLADLKNDIFKVACMHSTVRLTAKLNNNMEEFEEKNYEVVTNFTMTVS